MKKSISLLLAWCIVAVVLCGCSRNEETAEITMETVAEERVTVYLLKYQSTTYGSGVQSKITFAFDSSGRMTEYSRGDGLQLFKYDADGDIQEVIFRNESGDWTLYAKYVDGRLHGYSGIVDDEIVEITYTYDDNGNILTREWRDGNRSVETIQRIYYSTGGLREIRRTLELSKEYYNYPSMVYCYSTITKYNIDGKIIEIDSIYGDSRNQTHYEYDDYGNKVSETTYRNNATEPEITITYRYDKEGRENYSYTKSENTAYEMNGTWDSGTNIMHFISSNDGFEKEDEYDEADNLIRSTSWKDTVLITETEFSYTELHLTQEEYDRLNMNDSIYLLTDYT